MSQHVGIKLINQKNEVITEYDENLSGFINKLRQLNNVAYVLVYSIDEYDNTWFNKNQCEIAVKELEKMLTDNKFIDIKVEIKKLKKILANVERYQYILFVGD